MPARVDMPLLVWVSAVREHRYGDKPGTLGRPPRLGTVMDKEQAQVQVRHVSYSAFTDLLKCGKYHQLKRAMAFPGKPSWWLAGGSAVHAATEEYDRAVYVICGR